MLKGYYIDKGEENKKEVTSHDVFIYLGENQGYAPQGQHVNIHDEGYVKECKRISKEEYLKISGHLYTPQEYLDKIK